MRTLAVYCALFIGITQVTASDWPQFRGPDGQGHSDAKGIPLTWSETENLRWKVPIAGAGWSSPSIQGEQIWGAEVRVVIFSCLFFIFSHV